MSYRWRRTGRLFPVLSTRREPPSIGKKNTYFLQTVDDRKIPRGAEYRTTTSVCREKKVVHPTDGGGDRTTEPLSPTDEYYKQTTVCRETTTYFLHTMEDKQYPLYPLPHPNSTDSQILEVRRETGDAGTPPRYHKDTTDT
jgi:hypothetical protein